MKKLKLLKNWKEFPKWWSMQANLIAAVVSVIGAIATEQQMLWVTALLAGVSAVARVLDQGLDGDGGEGAGDD